MKASASNGSKHKVVLFWPMDGPRTPPLTWQDEIRIFRKIFMPEDFSIVKPPHYMKILPNAIFKVKTPSSKNAQSIPKYVLLRLSLKFKSRYWGPFFSQFDVRFSHVFFTSYSTVQCSHWIRTNQTIVKIQRNSEIWYRFGVFVLNMVCLRFFIQCGVLGQIFCVFLYSVAF